MTIPIRFRFFAILLLVGIALCIAPAPVLAQQTDTTQTQASTPQRWLVETTDGSIIQGVYLGQSEAGIRLLSDTAGEITIPMASVKSFKILNARNFRDGQYWFENPNATRYFYSPSAFSLKEGEFYYQNTYLVLNSINIGITDRLTIGAGFELISTFSGEPIYFITPKYTFPISDKWNAGAGILYVNAAMEDFSGLGVGYGIVTYGNLDDNITFGTGFGYVDGEASGKPVFTLSGMKRTGRNTAFVSENWLVPIDGYQGIYSYGIRFMGEKMTVDLAFLNNPDIARDVLFIGIPYVDFVVKFGK
ncbi:hypothetical protein ACXYMU_14370 [Pontibacter sp. CAU 1760]